MNPVEQRIAFSELRFGDWLKTTGAKPFKRTDHSLLYGGHDSFGCWIYKLPDGTLSGINYDSEEDLRSGTLKEWIEKSDTTNLNVLHEEEKTLTPNQKDDYVELLSPTGKSKCPWSTFTILHATAAQR